MTETKRPTVKHDNPPDVHPYTVLTLQGGDLGPGGVMRVRSQLAGSTRIEVDHCEGEGWQATQFLQCGGLRDLRRAAEVLAAEAVQMPVAEFRCSVDLETDYGDWTHVFRERGNGYPQEGAEVLANLGYGDVELLRLVRTGSIIPPERSGGYGRCYCRCEPAERSWGDLTPEERDEMYDSLPHVTPIEQEAAE